MRNLYKFYLMALSILAIVSCQKDNTGIISGSDAAVLSASVSADGITVDAGISDNRISAIVPMNTDLSKLKVKLVLSEGAEITPAPDDVTDWSSPVLFQVVSANGKNTAEYTMDIVPDPDKVFDTYVRIGNNEALLKFAENNYNVLGGLYIYNDQSGNPVRDLSILSSLSEIKTDLEIITDEILDITLPSLKSIGNIDINSLSVEKVSFPELETVSGRFRIGNDDSGPMPSENTTLTVVELNNLRTVGRSFVLNLCSALENIITPELEYVGENYKLFGGVYENLSMMKNITEIPGSVDISSQALISLEGFNLKKIGTSLTLSVGNLSGLEPLSVLESVPYINLTGGNDCAISSFKGMENISVDAMDIKGLMNVTSTEYLPVKNGMSHLSLQMMTNLTSLDGLENIAEIGSLHLVGLVNITDMHQLSNLKKVDNLTFQYMEELKELPDLKNITAMSGKLSVSMMRLLGNLKGLSSIKEVGALNVDNLLAAESLEGLESLEKITNGGMLIGACPKIKDLNPLANLKEMNMPSQQDNINITQNAELENYCAVRELLVEYWNAPGGKLPKVSITGNKYNPTYQQLVDGECTPAE